VSLFLLKPLHLFQKSHRNIRIHFDFHAHNDYDLSIANVMEAIKAGIKTRYSKRNGERAGNAPLESTVAVINDFLPDQINVKESSLYSVSKLVETFTGYRIPANKPIVETMFYTNRRHTC
jgi:D-citramalate synthase